MEHPRSPQMPCSGEPAGGLGSSRPTQDVFRTPYPLHVQDPSSTPSPKSSVTTPAIKQETSSPESQPMSTGAMILQEPIPMQWTDQSNLSLNHTGHNLSNSHDSNTFAISPGDFYPYTQNGMSYNTNYNVMYASQYSNPSCPRYQGMDLSGLPSEVSMSNSYPPAMYQLEPQKHYDTLSEPAMDDHLMQMRDDYGHHYGTHLHREDLSGYDSPYSDLTRSSTPTDSSPYDFSNPHSPIIDKDQPYAQLIYQALLGAKGHTMILRDIYDWFLQHTDKAASSETKGWQNSIRHNLSMNGAFEKVDHPSNEDSRKGFMWRLTSDALREGVKSTTRYRSKVPNKRGTRTQHPQPQRQASGAKGGQAARRSANIKRSKRVVEHFARPTNSTATYPARSVPEEFAAQHVTYPASYYSPASASAHDFAVPLQPVPKQEYAQNDLFSTGNQHGYQNAYVLSQSPSEPLFGGSPTPSADEPRTPMSVWGEEVEMEMVAGGSGSGMWGEDGMGGYQEYAG